MVIFKRAARPAVSTCTMNPDPPDSASELVDLSDLVSAMRPELSCLLGPSIQLATGSLAAGGSAPVRARRDEIVDLLRHLALDAHDAMIEGGTVTIRTGRLREAAECAAIVLHESPNDSAIDEDAEEARRHKGRSLGFGASYEMIKHAGGHFHVSCRDRDTVLTICFPLAE
jgi:hypothetical protein